MRRKRVDATANIRMTRAYGNRTIVLVGGNTKKLIQSLQVGLSDANGHGKGI